MSALFVKISEYLASLWKAMRPPHMTWPRSRGFLPEHPTYLKRSKGGQVAAREVLIPAAFNIDRYGPIFAFRLM